MNWRGMNIIMPRIMRPRTPFINRPIERHALSPDGWVAWGDVNYLQNDVQRAY